MSKFSSVIEAARKNHAATGTAPETPVAVNTQTQEPIDAGRREPVKQGKHKALNTGSSATINMGSGHEGITANREDVNTGPREAVDAESREPIRTSNLTVTIPTAHRNFWVGEARKRGTTVTAVIVQALTAKLGQPD